MGVMTMFTPTSPEGLVTLVTRRCLDVDGTVLVAIDAPDGAKPVTLADAVCAALRECGRPCDVVWLHDYVRPASLRFEHGRDDELSYRMLWFDYEALEREVLRSARTDGAWLPRLWDEATDRSARCTRVPTAPRQVLLVTGPMLLGRGLDFDVTVALQMSDGALRRHTPADELWTVPALTRHASGVVDPPDLQVRYDHPPKPAVQVLP
ncbi:hypothetical protein [Rhodococcus tibetensis]|uniref:Uridine kinase n=1 Tax=Rhodococcus tibetensis TaxID=2965064 RepID=A0ABT1Q8S1_9NOCA|nr:hypothetical protein [Rhodococcus sp. FXJ9.536]MCQ4118658.1 hypothetical protein [Rhodococcus sp. FXJ9.536]